MPFKITALCLILATSSWADSVSDMRPTINQVAQKYQLDPVLIEAIIRHETGNGTSKGFRNKNNVGGIMSHRGLRRFSSTDESIDYLGHILHSYHSRGLVSLDSIARRYAPGHRRNWVSTVSSFMNCIKAGKWGSLQAPDDKKKSK